MEVSVPSRVFESWFPLTTGKCRNIRFEELGPRQNQSKNPQSTEGLNEQRSSNSTQLERESTPDFGYGSGDDDVTPRSAPRRRVYNRGSPYQLRSRRHLRSGHCLTTPPAANTASIRYKTHPGSSALAIDTSHQSSRPSTPMGQQSIK